MERTNQETFPALQTISVPYSCGADERLFMDSVRRVYSAAVRSAYANSVDGEGSPLKQKDLRNFVKARFSGGTTVDAWTLHCATLEGMDLKKTHGDNAVVFGGKKNLERRRKGLISNEEWKGFRLRPLTIRGDKLYAGNRHFKLSKDCSTCTFTMMQRVNGKMAWRSATLHLAAMKGNAGKVLRQAAKLAAEKKINVTFKLDSKKVHVTVDPADLPEHPERRRPVRAVAGRALGIDLNPASIGLAAVENTGDAAKLGETKLLEHCLIRLDLPKAASAELVRETLAAVCDRAIRLCRKWGIGAIALEKGLGKLRSGGRDRALNRLLNYWARTVFTAMLRRKASLAGIRVIEVWGGYSTTIGNLAFEAPDACASAVEIARRGIAAAGGNKDVLPVLEEGWGDLRKDLSLPAELGSWKDVHQAVKAAKIGYRRPHPSAPPPVPGALRVTPCGHAVTRLRHRRRPGTLFRPLAVARTGGDSPAAAAVQLERACSPAAKSG